MSIKHRLESFGGILALENPPMLVHVDKDFMRDMGCAESPLWKKEDVGYLSAPLEVHLSVTNACSAACSHCYMDSGKKEAGELSGEEFRRAVDLLAEMGIFHMAMGGGEALERPDFFELAEYVRSRGIVPNLTTNGLLLTEESAAKCRIFGQVNVSLDSISQVETPTRRDSSTAMQGIDLLLKAGINVGLNCVVTRQNFNRLDEILNYASEKKLTDVEFLRLKPSGRGKLDYFAKRLTPAQNREFFLLVKDLAQKFSVPVKIDCSFVPMFCWHQPDKAMMERFSVYGCEAGNILLGVRSNGKFGGCSFLPGEENLFDLPTLWDNSEKLIRLRDWNGRAREACAKCSYLDICKGGCRAVSYYLTGDADAPDPECPFCDGQ